MYRHRIGTVSSVLVATTLALASGCGGSVEEQVLTDFFRASRMRDSVTLGNFATTEFDPRTDGIVQSFEIVSIGDERVAPMPLRQYAADIEQAVAAEEALNREKKAYQDQNLVAIDRMTRAEAADRPVSPRDEAIKAEWDKWRDRAGQAMKAVSDARRRLAETRGLAELSLARVQPPIEDVTQHDGEMIRKTVVIDASIRTPEGQVQQRRLSAELARARVKGEDGQEIDGRWIVTSVGADEGAQS